MFFFAHKQAAVEKKTKKQKGKYAETGVHMDAQANTHAVGHVYTNTQAYDGRTHMHTPLCGFIRSVSAWQECGLNCNRRYGDGCSTFRP